MILQGWWSCVAINTNSEEAGPSIGRVVESHVTSVKGPLSVQVTGEWQTQVVHVNQLYSIIISPSHGKLRTLTVHTPQAICPMTGVCLGLSTSTWTHPTLRQLYGTPSVIDSPLFTLDLKLIVEHQLRRDRCGMLDWTRIYCIHCCIYDVGGGERPPVELLLLNV